MRVILCGAGQVGWQIARQLSSARHDVVLIAQAERPIPQATGALAAQGVVGPSGPPG
ncbi:NAD-binding protein, partial [Paracoccus sphaerophysae]|uniref:NAD-binding protein n=1 Tax=Paracoccus sphaerophysae TaxID=690417 RepID=UPI0018DCD5C4